MNRINGTLIATLLGAVAFGNLKVVTTTEDLAAIARSVGGANVTVTAMVMGARDPHYIDAKPSYMALSRQASLFIAVGVDLEVAYVPAILAGSRNGGIQIGRQGNFLASEGVTLLEKPTGAISRAQGDVHPLGNPHYWLDPFNGRIIAQNIADRMSQLDPTNKSAYQSRAAAFIRSVDDAMFGPALVGAVGAEKLWAWSSAGNLEQQVKAAGRTLGGWAAKMEPCRGKPIVEYHPVYIYFAHRFGLRVVEHLEPKPGIPPTPGHISEVIRKMAAENCRVIIQPPYYSTRAAETVRSRTNAVILVTPASVGQSVAAKDYVSLIDTLVNQLSGALK